MSTEIKNTETFSLGKQNYILILIGVILVIIGFVLMSGGGSEDPAVFNEEIFSSRRITVAPLTILLGYILVVFAIMKKNS